jgi:hypothetical protein
MKPGKHQPILRMTTSPKNEWHKTKPAIRLIYEERERTDMGDINFGALQSNLCTASSMTPTVFGELKRTLREMVFTSSAPLNEPANLADSRDLSCASWEIPRNEPAYAGGII